MSVHVGDVVTVSGEDSTHLFRVWEIHRFGDGDDYVTLQMQGDLSGRPYYAALSACTAVAAADLPVQGERFVCPVFGETSEPHGDADCKATHTPVQGEPRNG